MRCSRIIGRGVRRSLNEVYEELETPELERNIVSLAEARDKAARNFRPTR